MEERRIKTNVSLSRNSSGKIVISVTDHTSRIEFLEVEMGMVEFAELMTGLAYRPAKAKVRGLAYVGMQRVTETRTREYEGLCYDIGYLEHWLKENGQEDGYELSSSLLSRGAVEWDGSDGGKTILRYSVSKFVPTMRGRK